VDASTLECLLLAQMNVHRFSDKQVTPAHLGLRGNILGVAARGGGLLAEVGNNQKRVGIFERGQDQPIPSSWSVVARRKAGDIMLRGGQ